MRHYDIYRNPKERREKAWEMKKEKIERERE